MNIKIIVNPRANDGKAKETGYEVEKFLHSRGIEYSLDSTYRPQGATSLAKKAVTDGFDLIIVVGGDGTVNEVLNGIVGSHVTMAVVPAGKENNFSLMMGLDPSNINEACEVAIGHSSKKLDVGKINDKYFLNAICFGLNADMAKDEINRGTGFSPAGFLKGKAAYVVKMLSSLMKFKSPKLQIKMGDAELISNVMLTKVSNGKYFGSGFTLSPNADMEDGQFDIAVFNDIGKIKFLYNMPKMIGNHNMSYPVSIFRHDDITVDSIDPIHAIIDGEMTEKSSSYRISMAVDKIPVKSK